MNIDRDKIRSLFLAGWSIGGEARAIAAAHPRVGFDRQFPGALLGSIGSFSACAGLLFPGAVRT